METAQWKNCPSDEDNNKKKNRRRKSQFVDATASQEPSKKSKKKDASEDEKAGFSQHFALYSTSVLIRMFIEVFFILLQYKLFGFRIPELYKCQGFPCPNEVDCFVSRPMEKTIFLWFMFIIAIISFVLNIAETYYLFWRWCLRKKKQLSQRRKLKTIDNQMHDITIHDAEIIDGGIIAPRNAPPDYRHLGDGDFEDDHMMRGVEFLGDKPLAMSVSLDDALITEHVRNGQQTSKLGGSGGPSGPARYRELTSTTSLDQCYQNLTQQGRRGDKIGKKGNNYYDYV